jgi:cyclophilin family peptidyl-prolyl cis-trans isomerase
MDHQQEQHALVECTTTAGPISLHLHRSWAPSGYDRATSLFERGYYDHSHFFRVVPHFLVQFGISYTSDSELKRLADTTIPDDLKRNDLMPFREGMVSFAGSGPNSRTSQLFIAYDHAGGLGNSPWETPFGEVTPETIENARKLYSGYGDMPPWGKGPEQGPIRNRGESYITENFPLLDNFVTCNVKRMEDSLLSSSAGEEELEEVADENAETSEEEINNEVDDPAAGAGEALPPDNEIAHHRGTRGGILKTLKLRNNSSGDMNILVVFGQISFLVVVAGAILYQCTLRSRRRSKHAEKRV